jgi:hypothetical protein
MKKLLSLIAGLMVLITTAQAAQQVFALQSAVVGNTTNLINGGGAALAISFVNACSVAVPYSVWDAPQTNSTRGPAQFAYATFWSNGAYASWGYYITNITRMYTNYYGATNSITASNVLVSVATTIPARTNFYRLLAAGSAAASSTTVIPLEAPLNFVYGLTITNHFSTNSSWIINWVPAL